MKYRKLTDYHPSASRLDLEQQPAAKSQMKKSKTSERKYTQMSFIFHLFFILSLTLLTACLDKSEYDFQSPQQATGKYRAFLHTLLPQKEVNAATMAKEICSWQELSDTIYNYIQQDPSFSEHSSLPLEFQLITDSVRSEFIRLSENCSLRDVAYVKLHTSPFRRDSALDSVKQEAASFFDLLDKQPATTFTNARDFMKGYQSFLESNQTSGVSTKPEFLEFLQQEDLLFRTFLLHLDECSEVGASAITQLTAEISASIYTSASEHKIATEDALVYMAMRTDRRILLNAQLCVDQIKEGKVKTQSSANAYLWMVLQPYLSMDSFAVSLLNATQSKQMMDIAEAYPTLIRTLSAQGLCEAKQSELIPTQLMRLYISTL